MNVNFLPDDRGRKVLRIEASWSDVSADYEEILSGYARVPVPGFRFGMVPRGVIEQRLQKQIVDDLSQRAAQRLAREALRESGVRAAGRIKVSDIQCGKGQPFRFTVRFWPRPEIELPDLCAFALTEDNPMQAGPGEDGEKESDPSRAAGNRIRQMDVESGTSVDELMAKLEQRGVQRLREVLLTENRPDDAMEKR